jgi:heptosyltransferase-2
MRLLCICPIGIGNYLLAWPGCARLKQARPDIEMHCVALRKPIRDLAAHDPLWESVYVFDPTRLKGVSDRIRVIRDVRDGAFDCSVNLFPSNKAQYNLLPFLAGVPRRYGFSYAYQPLSKLGFLLTDTIAAKDNAHDWEQNVSIAQSIARTEYAAQPPEFPKLYRDDDMDWARARLGSEPAIALHPGSSEEHGMIAKRWDPLRFAALADRICERIGARAIILGGPDEQHIKQTVRAAMRGPAETLEPVSLTKTAAVIKSCTLGVCNDSGLMHMCACQGVPTIGIFGPTDERRNGPVGAPSLVVRKQMDGFPVWTARNVGNRALKKHIDPAASLKALTPGEAWEQVAPWLHSLTGAP